MNDFPGMPGAATQRGSRRSASMGSGRKSSSRKGSTRKGSAGEGREDSGQGSDVDPVAEPDPHEAARSIVLRQLSMAPRSRHQLLTKLRERGISDQVAEEILDRYEEVQLIDDAEFARMWVRSRVATRSLARSAIKRELADKGITGELAEDALAQRTDEDEHSAAVDLVRRKLRPLADPADRAAREKQTRRLVAMLARKGYSPSLAFSIVREELDGSEELDGLD
ncbi:MAG: regulatory protein RecX [Actinomycetes bacterium]